MLHSQGATLTIGNYQNIQWKKNFVDRKQHCNGIFLLLQLKAIVVSKIALQVECSRKWILNLKKNLSIKPKKKKKNAECVFWTELWIPVLCKDLQKKKCKWINYTFLAGIWQSGFLRESSLLQIFTDLLFDFI